MPPRRAALSSFRLAVPRVLVALVSWNSAAHLREAIASVPEGVPVVVVDNASSDGSANVAREAGARVIDAGANLGFGPACNRAALEGGPSETILFLNPDAALVDGARTLAALLAALDADPVVAAVAPRLEGDGQELFQLRRLPSARALVREALLVDRLFPSNAGLRRDRYLDEDRRASFDVEQPAAAALLVRRDAFEALSGFDSAFTPAWFEDVDFCARLLESGWRIRYVPGGRYTPSEFRPRSSAAWTAAVSSALPSPTAAGTTSAVTSIQSERFSQASLGVSGESARPEDAGNAKARITVANRLEQPLPICDSLRQCLMGYFPAWRMRCTNPPVWQGPARSWPAGSTSSANSAKEEWGKSGSPSKPHRSSVRSP